MEYIGKAHKMRYLLQVTGNMEMLITRMRWKALYKGERNTSGVKTEHYGLKSSKTPKKVRSNSVISKYQI